MADKALHIGIDAREVLGRPTGVGHYLDAVTRVWAADPELPHTFTFFLPQDPRPSWLPAPPTDPRFRVEVVPSAKSGTWWEQTALPRAVAKANVDVFLGPAYTIPLRLPMPAVVFIHDVSFFAHPEWFGWREGLRRRTVTGASARRAKVVLTLSAFSATEIAARLNIPADRIVLAPPGAPPADAPDDTAREPIVLFVGSLFTRRRIPDLIRGFAAAAAKVPGARLILVGDNRATPPIDPLAIATAAGVGHAVEWRQYLRDPDLVALYRRARVFALLSEYEGYLMTPLEAFAHGVPAVLLDTPIAREAYGGAATLVGPGPDAVADAMIPLLTDPVAHAAAVAAGRARLNRASWRDASQAVLGALVRAAAQAAQ